MSPSCGKPTNYPKDTRVCELASGHDGRCQFTTVTRQGTGILKWWPR